MNNEMIDERLPALEKKIDAFSNLIDQQTQRAPLIISTTMEVIVAWEAKMKDKVTNKEAPVTNLENPIGQLAHH